MNYLAHCYLSQESPAAVLGSILGDFVKGRIEEQFTPAIRHSIILHRKIDSYTDSHDIFRASKRLIHPHYRRYAGILIDLFYDHFLARHWRQYSDTPLTELPERLLRILPRMMQDDWLGSYHDTAAIATALHGISRRLQHQTALLHAVDELLRHNQALEAHFFDYFPQLMTFVAEYKVRYPLTA